MAYILNKVFFISIDDALCGQKYNLSQMVKNCRNLVRVVFGGGGALTNTLILPGAETANSAFSKYCFM